MFKNQYGIATPSSLTAPVHPEDVQPNERHVKRKQALPPRVIGTVPPPWRMDNYRGSMGRGGSNRGTASRGGPLQYAIRGKTSWRGRGGQSDRHGTGSGHNNYGGAYRSASGPYQTTSLASHSTPLPGRTHQWNPSESRQDFGSPSTYQHTYQPRNLHVLTSVPSLACNPRAISSVRQKEDFGTLATQQYQASHIPPPMPAQEERFQLGPFNEVLYEAVEMTVSGTPKYQHLAPNQRWMARSRSPTPKLPPQPLKRRRVESEILQLGYQPQIDHLMSAPTPSQPSQTIWKPPLPGRARRMNSTPTASAEKTVVSPDGPPSLVQDTLPVIQQPVTVKRESRSPTPPVIPNRTLVTESCKFYPMPAKCMKNHPRVSNNRRIFLREKVHDLQRLRLDKTKSFWRADGLVIEWSSNIPVWSDTLRPETEFADLATAIERAHANNHTSSPKRKRPKESSIGSTPDTDICPREDNEPRHRRRSAVKPIIRHWSTMIEADEAPTSTLNTSMSPSRTFPLPSRSRIVRSPNLSSSMYPSTTISAQPEFDGSHYASVTEVKPLLPPPPNAVKRLSFKPMPIPRRNKVTQIDQAPTNTETTATSKSPPAPLPGDIRRTPSQKPSEKLLSALASASQPLTAHVAEQAEARPSTRDDVNMVSNSTRSTPALQTSLPAVELDDANPVLSNINMTDIDAENVDLLLRGTSEALDHEASPSQSENAPGTYPPADSEADDDGATIEELATAFLLRYILLFDLDRTKLERAYAKDAIFSCRVHHLHQPSFSMAGLFAPESSAGPAGLEIGRQRIVNRLQALDTHEFRPRGVTQRVSYDVVSPSPAHPTGDWILLTVYGKVVKVNMAGPHMDHVVMVDQSFVLRRREKGDDEDDCDGVGNLEDGVAGSPWPLAAVSHQMTVRDAPPLPVNESHELFPGMEDI
ncbi:hypothetical protein B0H34DRAFT_705404 [Crassisporium funariophilum]|nr:hypothetical protein B0H34DRAFT_705404 [Crassisporium funariophilum]